eukprot:3410667-Prymnesium_polylepis.1
MPCRRPQSPEIQPGALLALRTGLRKIAPPARPKRPQISTSTHMQPRRAQSTDATARLVPFGPPHPSPQR